MKKITYLFIALIGILAFSCAKQEADPVLVIADSTVPVLSSPATGGDYVLLEDNADATFATFAWSDAAYNLTNLADLSYTLQMDAADNNFANPTNLVKQTSTEVTYTVAAMNMVLMAKGFTPETAVDVSFRVVTSISSDSDKDDLISGVTTLTVTPYSAEVYVKPIYLLGDATIPQWDNNAALPFSYIDGGKFGIVTDLQASKGMKLISVLGAWAPQWGLGAGDAVSGTIAYRPNETVADPPTIPSPATAGTYRIVADTANLTYNIYAANANLYMLGDGCTAGWDNANALPLTNEGGGVFTITTTLSEGGYIKFIEVLSTWAPQWGAVDGASGYKGGLKWRPTESDPDPAAIPVPSAGTYTVTIDLAAQKYKLTPQ